MAIASKAGAAGLMAALPFVGKIEVGPIPRLPGAVGRPKCLPYGDLPFDDADSVLHVPNRRILHAA